MIYQNERAIYVKIADRVCDDILSGKYQEDERVPSVRELAAEYEVNTNTVLRTFDILQRDDIIYQRRGIGVFVSPGARHKIRIARKQEFRKPPANRSSASTNSPNSSAASACST